MIYEAFCKRVPISSLYSAHKFLGGPTAGIVAGRKPLVRAAFLQNYGIGRGMKVGKEGIAGTIAALDAWEKRDHAGVRARESGYLKLWVDSFKDIPGLEARIIPDPTNNPLDRLELHIDSGKSRHHRLASRCGARRRRSADHRQRPRGRAWVFLSRSLQSPSGRGADRGRDDQGDRQSNPRKIDAGPKGIPPPAV